MSIRSCTITIKGDGKGRYGKFKVDTTRTVKEFIVDNQHVYGKVLDHVKKCKDPDPCDPVEVLQVHLLRLKTPKRGGVVADSLFKNILRYKKTFGDRIPDELVVDAAKRVYSFGYFNGREPHLKTSEDVLDIFEFAYERARENSVKAGGGLPVPNRPFTGHWGDLMGSLVRFGKDQFPKPLPSREDLLKMVAVMEVLTA